MCSQTPAAFNVFRYFRSRRLVLRPQARTAADVLLWRNKKTSAVASALRIEINRALAVLHDIAAGRDVKKFLTVIAGLWILSIIGSWCNFLTLFYIAFVLLHSVPVSYEKYENQVDSFSEKAWIEIKQQYAVFEAKVLSKIPKGPLKEKKKD
ncbi:hypothetical protein GH714_040057 [Hevea brasiliensis]|uniref:Reticulon-like protein n=1 Tax=Hevea brasiliensis TaxID=3981 RepID=A0A6A6MPI9_HEVBR|nr:hypothetical protein GH714_040057 [Hevea brasiliensis]